VSSLIVFGCRRELEAIKTHPVWVGINMR